MAYTSYKYDVFISYARADDVRGGSDKGWVEQLHEKLRELLPQRLAGDEPVIFFDREKVKSNDQLDRLQAAAQNSAIFLAVVSDAYAARDWTRRELDAFISHNDWNSGETTRLFAIECLEPANRSGLPNPLNSHIGKPFWKKAGSSSTPMEPDDRDYRSNLVSLAVEIAGTLRAIRDAGALRPVPASAPDGAPRVLLAQTTEDLEDNRAKLQSYLGQFDIAVLPTMDYPQGGKEFGAAFLDDLDHATLFVQLLSGSPGRHPRDLIEGYSRFQFNAAKAKGIKIMQWHSPELQVTADAIADEEHRKLLSGEDIIVETLESFKERVKRKAIEKPAPAPSPSPELSSYVFIDADQDDLEIAGQIADELCRESLASGVPVLQGAPEDVLESVEGGIVQCDVLALLYGQSSAQWVDRHWKKYIKLRRQREAPPRALIEIWLVPPEKTLAPGTRLPEGIRRVQISAPVTRENLRPLIEALAK